MASREHIQKMREGRKPTLTLAQHLDALRDNGICGLQLKQARESLETMGESTRPLYIKTVIGTASPRQRIKCFCYECMGWTKKEVAECTSLGCPLYAVRPILSRRVRGS